MLSVLCTSNHASTTLKWTGWISGDIRSQGHSLDTPDDLPCRTQVYTPSDLGGPGIIRTGHHENWPLVREGTRGYPLRYPLGYRHLGCCTPITEAVVDSQHSSQNRIG
jgi:hypothetical protein